MKALVALLVLAIILVAIGWIGFSKRAGNPAIEFNTEKATSDVKSVVEKVEDTVSPGANAPQP